MVGEGPGGHGFGIYGWISEILIGLLPIFLIVWLIFAFGTWWSGTAQRSSRA